MRLLLVLAVLTAALLTPAAAQETTPEPMPDASMGGDAPPPLTVKGVILEQDLTAGQLIATVDFVNNDGCDMPAAVTGEIQNGVLWLDLVRTEDPAPNQACTRALLPGSAVVTLDISDVRFENVLYIIAGNYAARAAVDVLNNSAGTVEIQVLREITPLTLERLQITDISVVEIARAGGAGALPVGLDITMLASGCDGDPLVRVIVLDAAPGLPGLDSTAEYKPLVQVQAVRALEDAPCTREIKRLEASFMIPPRLLRLLSGEVAITDGANFSVTHDFGAFSNGADVPRPEGAALVPVETLAIAMTPREGSAVVTLTVSGSLADGCNFPRTIDRRLEGDTLFITLTEQRDPNAICTQVITPYTEDINLGSFPSGSYTVDVNGVVVGFTVK